MPTIKAGRIFDRAVLLLHDSTNIRWTESELLEWLNEAQREIVLLKPDAYSLTEAVQTAVGTKQALPAAGTMLLEVIRNMGVAGSTPGQVVRLSPRRVLDDQIPGWHSATGSAVTQHWTYEPEVNPRAFYIYPQSLGTHYLEICYAKSPEDVATAEDEITLDDIYSPALLNGILYRAYAKDADYAANAQRANQARVEFLQLIGRMDLMEGAKNPYLREVEKAQQAMRQSQSMT